jgi:hypothetical protein
MLKKISSIRSAFHKTNRPAVRYNLFAFCCLRVPQATKSKKDFHSHRGYSRRLVFQITIPPSREASNLSSQRELSFRRRGTLRSVVIPQIRNLLLGRLPLNAVKHNPQL